MALEGVVCGGIAVEEEERVTRPRKTTAGMESSNVLG
jgi:hypothetical protein